MTAIPRDRLSDEECYLAALLLDHRGIEMAEFLKTDPTSPDGCYRVWDFQWPLYSNDNTYQIDWCSRAIGKTQGIVMRLTGFVFAYPGQEALLLAPSGVHLQPIVDKLEYEIRNTRLLSEMLLKGRSDGIKHAPMFQIQFRNGSRILGRIPGDQGRNTKGVHSLIIETDESQEFDDQTWTELLESLERTQPEACWRAHGVSRGSRDKFYRFTMGEDADLPFFVHRYPAMYRPTWSDQERKEKIALYGGSADHPDYKRNIFGDHGDVSNRLFVLARLMGCVRMQESPWAVEYNDRVYYQCKLEGETLRSQSQPIEALIDPPATHFDEQYYSYFAGMDIGMTKDPTELLVFGEFKGKDGEGCLRLLTRLHMMRVPAEEQAAAVRHVFNLYGDRLRGLGLDRTGLGLPVFQMLDPDSVGTSMANRRTPEHISRRIRGYGFSEKHAVEFDDRDLLKGEKPEDAVIKKNVIEHAMDRLRLLVDSLPPKLELPYDKELLSEFQGQEVIYTRDEGGSGMKRSTKNQSFHTLDAAFMMILVKDLASIEAALKPKKVAPTLAIWG